MFCFNIYFIHNFDVCNCWILKVKVTLVTMVIFVAVMIMAARLVTVVFERNVRLEDSNLRLRSSLIQGHHLDSWVFPCVKNNRMFSIKRLDVNKINVVNIILEFVFKSLWIYLNLFLSHCGTSLRVLIKMC